LASDAKVFVDATLPVLPLQAALPRAVPVELAAVVDVLLVVPEPSAVPQVVARQAHPAAMAALEQVVAQVPSLAHLELKSLEPLVVQAQPPVSMPEQVLQVVLQAQTEEQQVLA
jgi:hypothetical protein